MSNHSINMNNMNNNYTIFNFLDNHYIDKTSTLPSTHTSMAKPQGNFHIPYENLDTFYELYNKALLDGDELHITEKHQEISPVLVDFDFRYEFETHERPHTFDHVRRIVGLYIKKICEVHGLETNDYRLHAFVFERDKVYQRNGVTKDGIHIIFPMIVTQPEVQYYIRDLILKDNEISEIFKELPLTNEKHEIIDKAVIYNNNWLMYGSCKLGLQPYQLKYIFDGELESIPIEDCVLLQQGDFTWAQIFSIRDKSPSEVIPVLEDRRGAVESAQKKVKVKTNYTITPMKQSERARIDIDEIKQIVGLLDVKRAGDYSTWMQVGWALHNISPSQEMLDIWIDFSSKSPKFIEGECEKNWSKSRSNGYTIASLYYWAKMDNYHLYKELREKNIDFKIEQTATALTHFDVAKILYESYPYEYKFTGTEWYEFKNHRWHTDKTGTSLRSKISDELYKKYTKLISKNNKTMTSDDPTITEEEKDALKKKNKNITNATSLLKNAGFKNSIMRECQDLYIDYDFESNLDSNPYLLGFNNGIYDLKAGILRDGCPDDLIQMSTKLDKIDFDEENSYFEDLKHFLETVFVDREIRDYFLTYLASNLQGHNAEEKIRIWTGTGSNGKSKIIELFSGTMGDYANKLPITLLTGKRAASNAATPEMAQAKGKRFCYLEEPTGGDKLDAGHLKELTGGDKVKARALHKEPIEFKPQFKIALLCNDIPEVPAHDSGVWRRMEIIEFKSKFTDYPKEAHEFPIDKQLSTKLPKWKELFMSYLIDVYYEKYKMTGIQVPKEVIQFTQDFQKECDAYGEFMFQTLVETKDIDRDVLELNDVYEEFKTWYVDEFTTGKAPTKAEFKKYLKKKYPTKKMITEKQMRGFMFKSDYEEYLKKNGLPTDSNVSNAIFFLSSEKKSNVPNDKVIVESKKIIKQIVGDKTIEEIIAEKESIFSEDATFAIQPKNECFNFIEEENKVYQNQVMETIDSKLVIPVETLINGNEANTKGY